MIAYYYIQTSMVRTLDILDIIYWDLGCINQTLPCSEPTGNYFRSRKFLLASEIKVSDIITPRLQIQVGPQ